MVVTRRARAPVVIALALVGPALVATACGESVLDVIDVESAPEASVDRDGGGSADARLDAAADVDRGDATGLSCADASPIGVMCSASRECCSGFCGSGATLEATCRPATGCLGVGSACLRAGACCSNGCFGPQGMTATCQGETACNGAGLSCGSNHDCCSNHCVSGSCVSVAGDGCSPAGEGCATDTDCCGRVCQERGGDTPTCALLQGCRPEGETCTIATDCCSERCSADAAGVLRCTALAECTSGDRKICSRQVGDVCKDNGQCCSRVCLANVDGSKRCASSGGCRAECEGCTRNGDCCSGACGVGVDGVSRCQPSSACGNPGEQCDKDDDCCKVGGTSKCFSDPAPGGPKRCHRPGTPACTAEGAACALTSECCSGRCVPSATGGHLCRQACVVFGSACSSKADCCGVDVDCVHVGGAMVCAPVVR